MRWLFFCLLVSTQLARAQRPFYVRHLTTADGLSQGSCYYIIKDSRGFMWISTQNGLNRFDGTQFTAYRFNDQDSTTIGKGEVRGIVEAPSGDLWIGTEECLNQYIRRTNTFRRIYATDRQGRRLSALQEPFFADDSTVWYASNQEGIMKLNYRTGRKTSIHPSVKPKFSISTEWIEHQPAQKTLIYLLPTGFARYNYQTHELKTFLTGSPTDQPIQNKHAYPSTKGILFHSIHRCHVRGPHYGNYCLAGAQGIFEFDATLTRLIRHHPLRSGTSLYRFVSIDEDAQGRWWLGASGSGVWLYNPDSMRLLREITPGGPKVGALLTNQVAEVYVDNLGLVWTNSDPFGIDVIYPNAYMVETIADDPTDTTDLNNHPIRGMSEDQRGTIWIGTIDGGIRYYNSTTGSMKAYTAKQGVTTEGNVRHILRTRDGRLLVANLQGLLQYDPKKDRFVDIPNPLCNDADCQFARGLCELPDGRFVMATYGGLFLLSPNLKPLARVDADGTYFGSLYFDPATSLLYTARRDQDLVVYRYEHDQLVRQYITLPGYNIMAFYPDTVRRCLWLCTDRGLVRFDPITRKAVRTYTVRDGLPDDVVYCLLPDRKGRFWLSTNNGLAKFFPNEGIASPVVSTKGREYNSHAALIGSDGTFYFGGVHGLDRFMPDQLDSYKASVPVRIARFEVNDQPYQTDTFVGETQALNLSHKQNTFSIGLAALDYLSQGKSQFLYRLSEVDEDWVPLVDANQVRYADLSPSDYIFQVRAIDARGQPTPITRLQINIKPPFWLRWWFWLFSGFLIALGVTYSITRYNRRKFTQQQRLLQNTLATQEAERGRIARDLHDDVGNTLAAIKGLLGLAQDRVAVAAQIPEVARAYAMLDKASNDLRLITHDLMPIEFEKYALPDIISHLVDRANRSSNTTFEFILFGDVHRLNPERELVLYRIIAELIQNALKHGGEGLAIVQLGYHSKQLNILVETPLGDNRLNTTFSKQESAGIGQKNITYRAEYLQAVLSTDSNAQSYTVMLDVPYDAAAGSASH
ncbi:histidine kinase [Spirosoma sp. RP8]|uniref:Histidine kinase n=1 Tax=Spirosoma liriopis TaxID=2937440 RepID=A0ABT0HMS5_9BACT|nr:sensor histidine kinase [Spirosoma liriopis]MCK8493437.1 histidine kinase [Spirosoma liriopis]